MPRGEAPFELRNWFQPGGMIFDEAFRRSASWHTTGSWTTAHILMSGDSMRHDAGIRVRPVRCRDPRPNTEGCAARHWGGLAGGADAAGGAKQNFFDARQQTLHAERLVDVVIHADVRGIRLVAQSPGCP